MPKCRCETSPNIMTFVYDSGQRSVNSSQYAVLSSLNLARVYSIETSPRQTNVHKGFAVRESFYNYLAKKNQDWDKEKSRLQLKSK